MFRSAEDFIRQAVGWLGLTEEFLEKYQLRGSVTIDHLCYHCKDRGRYLDGRQILQGISQDGVMMVEEWISGRLITTFFFPHPFVGEVRCVELCDCKPTESAWSGFHHAEIVPAKGLEYQALCEFLRQRNETLVFKPRPHHPTHDITLSGGFIIRLSEKSLKEIIIERLC